MTVAVGIDVGGTAAKLAFVDSRGNVLASDRFPTGRAMDAASLVATIAARVRPLGKGHAPAGIGIGVPATVIAGQPIDPEYCNVRAITGIDLPREIGTALGLPAWMENDAKAALRAEWRFGAARGARNAAIITLGTGIGSALLLNGSLREGAHGNHGEIGLTMVGAAGAQRPLEQWSAPGFIGDRLGSDLPAVVAAAQRGNREASTALDLAFTHLGTAVANLHLLLDLEVVVLAGAATALGQELIDRVAAAFEAACPPIYRFGLEIRIARLGELAGAVGAAALAQERIA